MNETSGTGGRWSVVIPFFNEQDFIGSTLSSLAAQTVVPDRVVLVDNASTDASAAVVDRFIADHPRLKVVTLREPAPGKASALKCGLEAVDTTFVATCDADTFYPPRYLERADAMFGDDASVAAVIAFGAPAGSPESSALVRMKGAVAARLMPSQAHGGGYGQSFRTSALKEAGGFSPSIWPYCLMDHEVIHRVSRAGRIRHDLAHWCAPSARRKSRRRVRWTLAERLLYHATPASRRDWLFYDFLARRFSSRGVSELNLREQPWSNDQAARLTELALARDP